MEWGYLSVPPSVLPSDVNILVNLYVKILELTLESGHTNFVSFLLKLYNDET